MKKIYISLPITGQEHKARNKVDNVMNALSKKGYKPVNPFEVNAGKNPTYNDHICYDLLAMLDCDGIFFCEGWQNSCGCCIEHNTAMTFKTFGKKNFIIMYEE